MKKPPAFWLQSGMTLPALLLAIPAWCYGRITAARMHQQPSGHADIPVICIGNFVVGGVGKTPFSLHLHALLSQQGCRPGFVLRGYGGRVAGPALVDPGCHTATEVGDEALLLAEAGPTVISRDRVAGAILAQEQGIDVLIMDDGFQNPSLAKDLCIVLVDAQTGVGNGYCVPAGPLRAPVAAQIKKADVLIVVGTGDAATGCELLAKQHGVPIFRAGLKPERIPVLQERPLLAYAGIGRPEKFFASLDELGLNVARTRSFGDHHPYSENDARELVTLAHTNNWQLVTTSKDMARMQSAKGSYLHQLAEQSIVLPVQMQVEDDAGLWQFVCESIQDKGSSKRA